MIIVNGFPPLTIITKHSILVVAAALDLPLILNAFFFSLFLTHDRALVIKELSRNKYKGEPFDKREFK